MSSAITVENLSKKYIIGHQKQERYTALRDVMANGAKSFANKRIHPFAAPVNDPAHEAFRALKNISFNASTNCRQLKMQSADGKIQHGEMFVE